ncbi:tryptophan synthase subunit alpha, partial [Pseudescherichia sp.]
VKTSLEAGAAGAISGSAIVKIIENNLDKPVKMLTELREFVQGLKAATRVS